MLTTIGMRPEWTTSGKEAVLRTRYANESADAFKAFIIDWLMPDMNGIEVVRRIRKEVGEQAPIIVLTAYDWTSIEDEAREAGVTGFCSKPLFLSELREVLSRPFVKEQTMVQDEEPIDMSVFEGRRILVAEDNELNRELIDEMLGEYGLQLEMAHNGKEAINLYESKPAGYYDLIISDIQMPVMDGYALSHAIRSLDDKDHILDASTLVISDKNKAVALAGIMGGENSEIVDDTTMVVFESANFNGTSIRQTALALGMRTEASGKFEKSLDPMMTIPAVQRACELVELLQCGDVLDGVIDIVNYVPQPKTLPLEVDKINRLLGTEISKEEMVRYLNLLEIPVEGDTILVPSFRPDLNLMADIAEEVGRAYGYNEIPTTSFKNSTQGGYTEEMKLEAKTGTLCRAMGYNEIITYSFTSPTVFDQIRLSADSPLRNALRIQNPLGEDTSIMRTIALPSMLEILSRNNAYHNKSVKLYEIAKIYLPVAGQPLPEEPKMLVLGTYGANETFFTLKGELEGIFAGLRLKKASYHAVKGNPSYHPGRCAAVVIDGMEVGVMGQVHPLVAKNYGIDTDVYCAEISFTKLLQCRLPDATYSPLPKYPAVTRDLALICDEAVTVAQAEEVITAAAGKLLRDVKLFDIYRGVGVPEGKKSMAFSLELRADDRTLTDTDSEGVVTKVLNSLKEKLNATLR